MGDTDKFIDINQSRVPLTTIYTFASGSDYADNANVMDMEGLAHLLQNHFLAKTLGTHNLGGFCGNLWIKLLLLPLSQKGKLLHSAIALGK